MIRCDNCGIENKDGAKFCIECGYEILKKPDEKAVPSPTSFKDVREQLQNALQGQYEIIEEIGRGGMGIVYKAINLPLERIDVIKVLPVELAYDREFVERFMREARTAAKLHHPNIITIYTVGREGNLNYMIMKYIEGQSVSEMLKEYSTIPLPKAIKIIKDICNALFYAHKEGVIHRDIKPDNIRLDKNGTAIVLDFGIAKAATSTQLTASTAFLGTAAYMAPEHIKGKADNRSDIYSLGCVFYKMLTGRTPFTGQDTYTINYKHLHEEPTPPIKFNPAIPNKINEFILKCLKKDPDQRFQSAKEALDELEKIEFELFGTEQEKEEIAQIKSFDTFQKVNELFKEGMDHFERKEYERAISIWEKLLSIDPSYIKGIEYIRLARAKIEEQRQICILLEEGKEHLKKEEYEEAIKCSGKVLVLDSENEEAINILNQARKQIAQRNEIDALFSEGDKLFSQKNYLEALSKFERILQLAPENKEAQLMIDEIKQILEKDNLIRNIIEEGKKLYQEREFEKAIEVWKRAYEHNPEHLETAQWISKAHSALEKKNKIQEYIETAKNLTAQGELSSALSLWEELNFLKPGVREIEENLKQVKQEIEKEERIKSYIALGDRFYEKQDFKNAIESWKKVLQIDPSHIEIEDKIKEAQLRLQRLERIKDLKAKGKELFDNGDYEKALQPLGEALTLEPDDQELQNLFNQSIHIVEKRKVKELLTSGKRHYQAGKYEKAIAEFEEVLEIEEGNEEAMEGIKLAREQLDKLDILETLMLISDSLLEEGRVNEAKERLEEALSIDPTNNKAKELWDKLQEMEEKPVSTLPLIQDKEFLSLRDRVLFGKFNGADITKGKFKEKEKIEAVNALLKTSELINSSLRKRWINEIDRNLEFETNIEIGCSVKDIAICDDLSWESAIERSVKENGNESPLLYNLPAWQNFEVQETITIEDQEFTQAAVGEHTRIFVSEEAKKAEEAEKAKLPLKARIIRQARENPILYVAVLGITLALALVIYLIILYHRELTREKIERYLIEAQVNQASGRLELALMNAQLALDIDPKNQKAISAVNEIKEIIKKKKEEEERAKKIQQKLQTGIEALENGNYQGAVDTFQDLLSLDPNHELAKYYLEQAKAGLDKVLWEMERQQKITEFMSKGKEFLDAGNYMEAIATMEQLLEKVPGYEEAIALKSKAEAEIEKQNREKAVADYLQNGKSLFEKKDYNKARFYFQKALKLDPKNDLAKDYISKIDAIANAAIAEQKRKESIENHLRAAKNFFDSKQFKDCINEAKKLLEIDPGNKEAEQLIKKSEQLIKQLAEERKLQEQIDALYSNAEASFQKGDYLKAIALCNEILALKSDFEKAISLKSRAETAYANIDRESPTITHKEFDKSLEPNKPIKIECTVKDNVDVSEVLLFYRDTNQRKYSKVKMTRTGNIFTGVIPATDTKNTTEIEYYFVATDTSQNQTTSSKYKLNITEYVQPPPLGW